MAFAAALGALALTALVLAATLRLETPVSFLLAAYLLASAEVVLLTEVLSPLRLVDAWSYAIGEAVLLVAAATIWSARGRPPPPMPRLSLGAAARAHPVLAGLAAAVALGVCYELFLVLTAAPNNGDSLTYHLTRAAAWLKHGGVYRIPGGSTAENDYPPNGEIEVLYTLAFIGRDTAAALPQFLAQGALAVAVFGLARRLGFARPAALLPALLAPTLSEIALQATTTQNDLLVAAFVASAAYFLLARQPWLAGVAVGLALGTKLTAVFALVALVPVAVASLRRRERARAAAAAIVGFAALGSAAYVTNLVRSGSPLGALSGEPGLQRPEITFAGTVSTVARYTHDLIDLPGYPLDHEDLRIPAAVARRVFLALQIPPNPSDSTGYPFGFAINVRANEDLAFFGPLGVLLVLPLVVAFPLLWARGRAPPAAAALAAALPLYLLALALGYRYSGQGRFLITPVALVLPLAAAIYRWRLVAAAAALVGVVTLVFAHAHNELKPTGLRGTTPVWRLSRSETLGLGTSLGPVVDRLERVLPEDATLGVVVGEHDADYVLYGPELSRRIVRLDQRDPLADARRRGLRWVFLGRFVEGPARPAGWTPERVYDAGTLLTRSRQPNVGASVRPSST